MYLVPNIHPGSGSAGVPTVQANFAGSPADWTTLSTVSSMPSGGSISRAGNAMLYDSTGKLVWAQANLVLNSATLSTQTITPIPVTNYILSFSGTGSVAISGGYTGSLAGTGASNRVYLAFASTTTSLTLTVTGSVTSAQLEPVTYQTTPSTYVATTSAAYYGPRFDYDPSTLAAKGLLIEGTRTNLLNFSQSFATSGGTQNNWADTNITRNSTNNTSPDGTGNALRVTASAANGTIISSAAIGTSAQRVLSVWLRRVTGTGDIQYTLDNGTNWTTQAITSTWTRYSFAATTADQRVGFRIVTSGDAIEIWGVQLEAAAFSSSYVFTGSSTVARAAETFAITGYTSNLINTNYIDEQTGNTYQQPYNAGVAPSPSFSWLTALRVYTNAYAGSIASPSWLSFSRTSNALLTDSTGKLTFAPNNLLLNTATLSTQTVTTGIIPNCDVILSFKGTGSVAISGGYTGTLAGTGASNRVSLNFTTTTASLTFTVTGTVTEAQLERVTYETQPSLYVATTSSQYFGPRYDYDASTVPATPRGLLIEESRANLLTYSDTMSSGWNTANATFSQASITSPAGTGTVAQVGSDGTAAYKSIYLTPITTTAAANYTASVYVKANTLTRVSLAIISGTNDVRYWYDLSAKTVGGAVGSFTTGYVSSSIQDVGNGWLRCTLTATAQTTTGGVYLYPGKADISAAGNVYMFGAQLEAGSFATSYIPTTSASVTRAADVAQLTGSALTTLQGTKASALIQTSNVLTNANAPILGQASGVGNAITLYYRNGSSPYTASTYNATTELNDGNITNLLTSNRVGVAWDASGRSVVGNNGTVVTDTNSIGSLSAGGMELGHASAAATTYLCGYVASLALYNQRLPDAILKQKSSVNAPY